jgi:uncharacterized protein with HEPN domain
VPPRDWRVRIEDILDAAERVARYVQGKDLAAFVSDDLTLDAVSRCFGIIGEAANHVPEEVTAAHPAIPWAEMRAMRNVVVHEYFGVTNETLFKTATEDLPAVIEPLKSLLAGPEAVVLGQRRRMYRASPIRPAQRVGDASRLTRSRRDDAPWIGSHPWTPPRRVPFRRDPPRSVPPPASCRAR